MSKKFRMLASIFAVAMMVAFFAAQSSAECGFVPKNHKAGGDFQPASFQPANQPADPIVGLWQVDLISEGNDGIPDGTVIDAGYSQWHSDGTEILNSSRVPATGSFCLGVWKKTAQNSYKLNHFALSWDPNGNFVGPANIREQVSVDRASKTYSGTFTLDQFDTAGNVLAHLTGNVSATRINVDTPPSIAF